MAFEMDFASEIPLSAIKLMICRRFSLFLFDFWVLWSFYQAHLRSSKLSARIPNTCRMGTQNSIMYVVFKISNIAFFMVLSIGYCVITTHRPSLRPPSRTKIPFFCKSAKSRCIVRVVIPVFCDISLALNVGFSCMSFIITV